MFDPKVIERLNRAASRREAHRNEVPWTVESSDLMHWRALLAADRVVPLQFPRIGSRTPGGYEFVRAIYMDATAASYADAARRLIQSELRAGHAYSTEDAGPYKYRVREFRRTEGKLVAFTPKPVMSSVDAAAKRAFSVMLAVLDRERDADGVV